MTTDVKLLPMGGTLMCRFVSMGMDEHAEAVEAYARANMEPLMAENERLRADAAREFERSARLGGQLHESQVRAERLADALRKAREDINWMLNNRQLLNSFVFDYIDAALDQEGGNG